MRQQQHPKWCVLDYGKTAHWWLGREGTACGRDFTKDVRKAHPNDERCRECYAALMNGNI